MTEQLLQFLRSVHPELREPGDIADVCLFLASPLARYVSGENVVVHGGGERPAFLGAAAPVPPA